MEYKAYFKMMLLQQKLGNIRKPQVKMKKERERLPC